MSLYTIAYYVCCLLAFVPAIVLHEVSHGYAAYRLGDPTAKRSGRLTLNPLAHIDPFGTVILPLLMLLAGGAVFGYAKPVPYNPTYFKNKRVGDFIVGMAGPAANLVMALGGAVLAWALLPVSASLMEASFAYSCFYGLFLPLFVLINLYLMFFNLLPVPPLDGSSIFALFIPESKLHIYYQVERWAMPVLLVVIFLIPYLGGTNILGVYLDATAGNLADLVFPYRIV